MTGGLFERKNYWLPTKVNRAAIAPRLEEFYASRADYHQMTNASKGVGRHPQVELLLQRIKPTDRVAEFGCGGGEVLQRAGQRAKQAIGFDIGSIALGKARARPGNHRVIQSDVANVPLPSNYADIAYSFEVLEHVWDPASVLREMVRVVRPGGTIIVTTPNGFSMDMHLRLRLGVRIVNLIGAAASGIIATLRGLPYENIPPNLDASPCYSDCDMITRVHPRLLRPFAEREGCKVERLETYFFLREKAVSDAQRRRFRRLERHWFYRHHGDHILLVATKEAT